MGKEALSIGISDTDGVRVLSLVGDLDSYTSGRLASLSRTWLPGAQSLVVDLDRLGYIDSSGLSALVELWVAAKDHGAGMLVLCHNPRIQRVFEITGLNNFFTMETGSPAERKQEPAGQMNQTEQNA